jgi:DNA-binding sugar fermentation-stimulating protein
VAYLYTLGCTPGMFPIECATYRREAETFRLQAVKSIKRHLAFIASHSAATCFRDAYSADRRLGSMWLDLLQPGVTGSPYTAGGRRINARFDRALASTGRFLSQLSGYFTDCR